ncbi:MAG: RdgB/HAM1 family non-canonical purine NTP pyrophosphatase [Ignavibacteria bacterium]|jgi:XTP/dITP diphosphohydrolase|nr:RdgB/HAM1 family non-canonical purine NTP pyrophosphatase [Ignavibacteria bacterium]MDH7527306.1 RdgB/HAM1 family non-canonical purine NTP pyrophosphatase [Ignavibacteria bacterium]
MKIVLATNNPNKVKEVKEILNELGVEVLTLKDLGIDIEIIEDQDSFEGNARKKAHTIFEITKIPTIADDSGLIVEQLNGAPGVYSSRYAGEEHNYEKNNQKLLQELKDKPKPHRAKFICVINYKSETEDEIFTGMVDGEIVDQPRGTNGFGYDPLFKPDGFNQTYAELPSEIKNKISHRYKALLQFRDYLFERFKKVSSN